MPEDRTPIDHGLAHPQPERGTIPQPQPRADEDPRELVPNQRTTGAATGCRWPHGFCAAAGLRGAPW